MHKQFLLTALEQAWIGRGVCAPNPSVGAVAVQNGVIIAQAWHRGAGTPHAEQLLLAQLPAKCSGITLYVTLEPCNHWGRTPPCVDAIIQYGIERVVYAYRDPNPVVKANDTPMLLGERGIEVIHFPLPEIDDFYQSYCHWILTHKPLVTAKIAQTFDGKIAGNGGERILLSNSMCAEFTHKKRLHSDVILTTANTINQDDPLLNVRLSTQEASKPVVIIDSRGTLKNSAKVLNTATHCHIYHDEQFTPVNKYPNCSYYPVPALGKQLDLIFIINHLGQLGFHDVWVEAGGRLFSALHRANLVAKTFIYLVPALLGDEAIPAYQYTNFFSQPFTISWQSMGDNMIASLDWQGEAQGKTCLPV